MFYFKKPEIAVRHGYVAETHTVETEDGEYLKINRGE